MHIESLERRCPMDATLGSELVWSELALRELDDAAIACEVAMMPGPVWVQPDTSSPHEPSLPHEARSPSEFGTQPNLPAAESPSSDPISPTFETDRSDVGGQEGLTPSQEPDTSSADAGARPTAPEGNKTEPMLRDGDGLQTLVDPLQLLLGGSVDPSLWAAANRLPSNQTMKASFSTGGVRLLYSEPDTLNVSSTDFAHDDTSLTDTVYFRPNEKTDTNDRVLESVAATLTLRRFAVRSTLAGNGMSLGSISIGPMATQAREMKSRPLSKAADDRDERMASGHIHKDPAVRKDLADRRDLRQRRDLLDRASEALVDLALKAFVKDASQAHGPNAGNGMKAAAEAVAVTQWVQPSGGQTDSRESRAQDDPRAAGAPTLEFARNLCRIAVLGFVLTQHGMLKKANADILKRCLKR